MTLNLLSKFNPPIFNLDLNLTWDVTCIHSCRKKSMSIITVVLETPACQRLYSWEVTRSQGGIEWDCATIGSQLQRPTKKFQKSVNSSRIHMWHATSSYTYRTYIGDIAYPTTTAPPEISFSQPPCRNYLNLSNQVYKC